MCEKCLKKRGLLLEFIPDEYKTEPLCLLAVKQDYEALKFVPQHLLTNDFFIKCLKINFAKSELIPLNLTQMETASLVRNLKCKLGKLPLKYLGLWISGGRINKEIWLQVVDKIKNKLPSWKGKFLSIGVGWF